MYGALQVSSVGSGVAATSLTDDLERDLVASVHTGETLTSVLERHGVHPQSLSDWRKIADGEMTHWRSGNPVSDQMRQRCRRLCIALLEAEIAVLSKALRRLKRAG